MTLYYDFHDLWSLEYVVKDEDIIEVIYKIDIYLTKKKKNRG